MRKIDAAAEQPNFFDDLRRAVLAARRPAHELAQQIGGVSRLFSDFQAVAAELPSAALDRPVNREENEDTAFDRMSAQRRIETERARAGTASDEQGRSLPTSDRQTAEVPSRNASSAPDRFLVKHGLLTGKSTLTMPVSGEKLVSASSRFIIASHFPARPTPIRHFQVS